jgi:hypothetical protein
MLSEESKCLVNYPRTMFKMQLNSNLNELLQPNELSLVNSEVINVFWNLNSIIQTTEFWGKVTLTNSVFKQMNICGGIVKTYYMPAEKPNILENVN